MSRSARRTAESAAIALVLATGVASGLVAAELAASDTQTAIIAPAAEHALVAPVPQPPSQQTAPVPSYQAPQAPSQQTLPAPSYRAPAAPHISRSS